MIEEELQRGVERQVPQQRRHIFMSWRHHPCEFTQPPAEAALGLSAIPSCGPRDYFSLRSYARPQNACTTPGGGVCTTGDPPVCNSGLGPHGGVWLGLHRLRSDVRIQHDHSNLSGSAGVVSLA